MLLEVSWSLGGVLFLVFFYLRPLGRSNSNFLFNIKEEFAFLPSFFVFYTYLGLGSDINKLQVRGSGSYLIILRIRVWLRIPPGGIIGIWIQILVKAVIISGRVWPNVWEGRRRPIYVWDMRLFILTKEQISLTKLKKCGSGSASRPDLGTNRNPALYPTW